MLLSRGPGNPSHHLPPLSVCVGGRSGCGSRVAVYPNLQRLQEGRVGQEAGGEEMFLYIFLTSFSLGGGWTDVTLGVLGRAPTRDLLPGILPEDS